VRPAGGSPSAFAGVPAPEECSVAGCVPRDVFGRNPSGECRGPGFDLAVRSRRDLIGTRSEPSERDIAVVGGTRGQVPVANLMRVGGVARPRESGRWQRPEAPRVTSSEAARKAHEGKGREAGPTAFGSCSEEAQRNPGEHRSGRASVRSGTDPHEEKHPGAAGHRGLLVLRAEERDVRNGKRAQAPKGVRLREGEKL
jgi:hypothetical protein